MTLSNASAISAFLARGGQIVRVQEAIRVTAQDVLDYLKSCGVVARHSGRESKVYLYEGKRVKLGHVVAMANRQRDTQQLPPFVVQL
jgi:hypothetical protein